VVVGAAAVAAAGGDRFGVSEYLGMQRVSYIALFMLVSTGCGCSSVSSQTHFASPAEAVDSFVSALRANDDTQLKKILGPEADEVLSSGDQVADQEGREKLLALYDARHELVEGKEPDAPCTLLVGETGWPFPIPVVMGKDGWYFETAEGNDEILNRRIGRNELSAIQVCLAIVDAQREYAQRDPTGVGLPIYAQKFKSDPGTKDGLFWPVNDGEDPSPLGELVAKASQEGYKASQQSGQRVPYHGYHYRILTSQGAGAPGGARDYVMSGKLLGGFAVVAWPDQYGNSGVMTFITNQDGVVYQKDLGTNTQKLAESMTSFDPGDGWKKAE
jgi:hypothetical protein